MSDTFINSISGKKFNICFKKELFLRYKIHKIFKLLIFFENRWQDCVREESNAETEKESDIYPTALVGHLFRKLGLLWAKLSACTFCSTLCCVKCGILSNFSSNLDYKVQDTMILLEVIRYSWFENNNFNQRSFDIL